MEAGIDTKRILVAGASGTIGLAVVNAALAAGHHVIPLLRNGTKVPEDWQQTKGLTILHADVTDQTALRAAIEDTGSIDVVISCLASRTGAPRDAELIDYRANHNLLSVAQASGVGRFLLLSAICVQRPRLAFQHAKLKFENELSGSGLLHTIIRPTAFFKSLSGQVERVRQGKPFLLFGDGKLTRCKPISDADLACFIINAIDDPDACNQILPIGGPGPAIFPKEQGAMLFGLLGEVPQFRSIAPSLFLFLSRVIRPFGLVSNRAAEKSEYLRIAHYYATESMLLLDPETGEYCAEATPETGTDTLEQHYRNLLGL